MDAILGGLASPSLRTSRLTSFRSTVPEASHGPVERMRALRTCACVSIIHSKIEEQKSLSRTNGRINGQAVLMGNDFLSFATQLLRL